MSSVALSDLHRLAIATIATIAMARLAASAGG